MGSKWTRDTRPPPCSSLDPFPAIADILSCLADNNPTMLSCAPKRQEARVQRRTRWGDLGRFVVARHKFPRLNGLLSSSWSPALLGRTKATFLPGRRDPSRQRHLPSLYRTRIHTLHDRNGGCPRLRPKGPGAFLCWSTRHAHAALVAGSTSRPEAGSVI